MTENDGHENDEHENDELSKLQDTKLQDKKNTVEVALHYNGVQVLLLFYAYNTNVLFVYK